MMKKLCCVLLVMVALGGAAVAEETDALAGMSANGIVRSANTYEITAPFSGVLLPFDWETGDEVKAQDVLFVMDTVKVYAPEDGTLQAVFADVGELCEDVVAQYGMIACIEKDKPLIVEADTSGAYSSTENKIIHIGETVYFQQSNDKDNEGEGRVISISAETYVIELTKGEFDPKEGVKIYRDEKLGTKTCIGSGTIARAKDIAVMGSGRMLKLNAEAGQKVKKGQLLFELATAEADAALSGAQILAAHDGAVEIRAAGGQQTYKGQALATIHDLMVLTVAAEVDEMDLGKVAVGDSVNIVFDRYPEQKVPGTVRNISRIGVKKQNATYYDVEIAFTTSVETLPGMNATIWFGAVQ